MCRTVHAVLQTAICGIQMLVRVFMTIILMIENVIRMLLQTAYNFISFLLQMVSLIPICVVFLLTARLKCFMCGGGGPCPVNRGGTCDCLMSLLAFVILYFIFRATGVLDKIFYSLGYSKTRPTPPARFVPTPGDVTECSRNDSHSETFLTESEMMLIEETATPPTTTWEDLYETVDSDEYEYESEEEEPDEPTLDVTSEPTDDTPTDTTAAGTSPPPAPPPRRRHYGKGRKIPKKLKAKTRSTPKWTTIMYYLV